MSSAHNVPRPLRGWNGDALNSAATTSLPADNPTNQYKNEDGQRDDKPDGNNIEMSHDGELLFGCTVSNSGRSGILADGLPVVCPLGVKMPFALGKNIAVILVNSQRCIKIAEPIFYFNISARFEVDVASVGKEQREISWLAN